MKIFPRGILSPRLQFRKGKLTRPAIDDPAPGRNEHGVRHRPGRGHERREQVAVVAERRDAVALQQHVPHDAAAETGDDRGSALDYARDKLRRKGCDLLVLNRVDGGRAFEVVGIPLKKPGLYIVELESTILGNSLLGLPRPMFVPTAVLVTNLSVHFKWGRESSLVFVTTLDTGSPVPDASVSIRDCLGGIIWQGTTDANGIARINKALPDKESLPRRNPLWVISTQCDVQLQAQVARMS